MEPFSEGEYVQVYLDDWLVRLKWAPGIAITEEYAQDAMAEVNRICGSSARPMVVDMRGTQTISRAARAVFTVPCAANAIALLGESSVDRVIANFVLGISKLPTPTKYFNSEDAAVAWLELLRAGQ